MPNYVSSADVTVETKVAYYNGFATENSVRPVTYTFKLIGKCICTWVLVLPVRTLEGRAGLNAHIHPMQLSTKLGTFTSPQAQYVSKL